MQVVPGQADNPRFVAGTVPLGTNITVPISVVDQEISTATLTVTYKTPDMPAGQTSSAQLNQTGTGNIQGHKRR